MYSRVIDAPTIFLFIQVLKQQQKNPTPPHYLHLKFEENK